MRHLPAIILLAAAAAPAAALADTTYPLDKVSVVGNSQVPTATLDAVIQEKPGTKVTKDEIIADQDNIVAAYKKANVGMQITVLLATKSDKHVEVTFKVDEKAAPPPTTVSVPLKIAHVTFAGNVLETTDALQAAAAIKPGDIATADSLKAAEERIMGVYKANKSAKLANVNLTPQITYPSPGLVDVVWQITETKGKKKPRNTEDPGGQTMDQ
jgi:outer membrane protein assembly factor BamA